MDAVAVVSNRIVGLNRNVFVRYLAELWTARLCGRTRSDDGAFGCAGELASKTIDCISERYLESGRHITTSGQAAEPAAKG